MLIREPIDSRHAVQVFAEIFTQICNELRKIETLLPMNDKFKQISSKSKRNT